MTRKEIDIVGAGIGGLTAALALEQQGFQPTIYEQAAELRPVGAGILLASNAMRVYRKLGIEAALVAQGMRLDALNVRTSQMKILTRIETSYFKNKYDLSSVSIHRGALQQVLLDSLEHTTIYLDHKLDCIEKNDSGYILNFENGQSITSSLLIGADGERSKVRDAILPNSQLRSAEQVCWRGVVDFKLPEDCSHEVNELWGRSGRVGFVEISKGKVYWFALKSYTVNSDQYDVNKLTSYFDDFPSFVKEMINVTPVSTIHTSMMGDLKPISTWYDDQACLIGDAAHSTTPNMGQGACQAIEDALVIAQCLSQDAAPKAFAEFQKTRISAAHYIVNQSWTLGKVAHWKNPIAVGLRNTLFSMVPKRMNYIMMDKLFQLNN